MPDICTCFTGMPKNITFAGDFKNDIWGEYSLDSDADTYRADVSSWY